MKIIGIVFSALAGSLMSIQGVLNTRLNSKTGLWEAHVYVQGIAFLLSLIAFFVAGKGNLGSFFSAPNIYRIGGILGIMITVFVIVGMGKLNPAYATAVILIAQLLTSGIISAFALLGTEKVPFGMYQYIGTALMLAGVVLFKM